MIRYHVFDPTGNLTALVESPVPVSEQKAVADTIMALRPSVEQVGFLTPPGPNSPGALRMAGGEFCGNASMSAAACFALEGWYGANAGPVFLTVSGADAPVEVRLSREEDRSSPAAVKMPPARCVETRPLTCDGLSDELGVVTLPGISHIVIPEGSPFHALLDEPRRAERVVRALCASLKADCLGLMFLSGEGEERTLTPLVFVPGSGTLFWESSCASGSAAVGLYLAAERGGRVCLSLRQRGGTLRVDSDGLTGETWLRGRTRLLGTYTLPDLA